MRSQVRTGITTLVAMALLAGVTQSASAQTDEQEPNVYVRMTTNKGDITLELDAEKAPISVANFLQYVDVGFYDGTIFHRVIPNFMIQGGGFTPDMTKKPTRGGIQNEWQNGLKNVRGSIAMARTSDPNSGTCQFFINVVDNASLDKPRGGAAYAVFGRVVGSMDAVEWIRNGRTRTRNGMQNVPVESMVIESAQRVTSENGLDELLAQADSWKELPEIAKTDQLAAGKKLLELRGLDLSKGVTTDSGLFYIDITEGTGDSPSPTDKVTADYTGWLVTGTIFDSSVAKGRPLTFSLNGVIAGWTEGLGSMKPGGRRVLLIPPELGYGQRGSPPVIGPNAHLIFEVELIRIAG